MKSNIILTLLSLLIILITIVTTVAIVIEVVFGYSGFSSMNGEPNLIQLRQNCSSIYFTTKYGDAINITLKVSFISTLATMFFSILCIFIILSFIYGCYQMHLSKKEETGIEENHQSQQFRQIYKELYYPSLWQNILLYIFFALMILLSFIPFKNYLQFLIQQNNQICPLSIQRTRVQAITILNGIVMVLSLIAIMLTMKTTADTNERLVMLEMQNKSQSFRQQIRKIMKQIPLSERGLNQKQENKLILEKNTPHKVERQLSSNQSKVSKDSKDNQVINLQRMQKVQSIIYQPSNSLMLQSVNRT